MEALSGTLMTAKKRGVVSYDGNLLFQGGSDHVLITLLQREIADSPLPDHSKRKAPKAAGSGFQPIVNAGAEKCAACEKTVFAGERVGAAGKSFHESCFKCTQCKRRLEPTNFSNNNSKNYCTKCQSTTNKATHSNPGRATALQQRSAAPASSCSYAC